MFDVHRSPHRGSDRPSTVTRRQLHFFARRVALLGAIVAGLLALGTVGLVLAEGVGGWYAFRWALDTAATVGGFPQPRTLAGQIIHVLLIVLGVGTLFYGLVTVTELFVGGPHGRRSPADGASEDDRLAHRPSHHLRLRPRGASGRP